MDTDITAYMMRPAFFPIGRSATNQEVVSILRPQSLKTLSKKMPYNEMSSTA